jgi:hypothetical protein
MASTTIQDRLAQAGQLTPLREGRTRLVIASDGNWAKHDNIMLARINAGRPKYFKVFDVPADATVSSFGAIVYPATTDIHLLFEVTWPPKKRRS